MFESVNIADDFPCRTEDRLTSIVLLLIVITDLQFFKSLKSILGCFGMSLLFVFSNFT